jgi:hypothetical protein
MGTVTALGDQAECGGPNLCGDLGARHIGPAVSDQALDGYVVGVVALEGVHRGDDVVVFADGERCGNAELTHGVAFRVRARQYWQQCRDSNAVLSVVGWFITLWGRM